MVFALVYSSVTSHAWTERELVEMLVGSRERNAAHDITGLLLYRDHAFMQLLEGEEDVVMRLFDNIRRDARHTDVDLLWTDVAAEREFPDWSMAFRRSGSDALELPGYDDLLNAPVRTNDRRPSVVTDFLAMFTSTP